MVLNDCIGGLERTYNQVRGSEGTYWLNKRVGQYIYRNDSIQHPPSSKCPCSNKWFHSNGIFSISAPFQWAPPLQKWYLRHWHRRDWLDKEIVYLLPHLNVILNISIRNNEANGDYDYQRPYCYSSRIKLFVVPHLSALSHWDAYCHKEISAPSLINNPSPTSALQSYEK